MIWHTAESGALPKGPGNYLAVSPSGNLIVVRYSHFYLTKEADPLPWWSDNFVAWAEPPEELPDFSGCKDWVSLQRPTI